MITPATDPYGTRQEIGSTIADALALLKKAKRVAVAVPSGFDNRWSYCTISKKAARDHLTTVGFNSDDALHSCLDHFAGGAALHIGSPYNERDRHSEAKAA